MTQSTEEPLSCVWGHPISPLGTINKPQKRYLPQESWDDVLKEFDETLGHTVLSASEAATRISDLLRRSSHPMYECSVCEALVLPDEKPFIDFEPESLEERGTYREA